MSAFKNFWGGFHNDMTSKNLQIKTLFCFSRRGRRSTTARRFGGSFRNLWQPHPAAGDLTGLLTFSQEHFMGSQSQNAPNTFGEDAARKKWTEKKIKQKHNGVVLTL